MGQAVDQALRELEARAEKADRYADFLYGEAVK